ncbi:hypothetical protein B484DRAFT_402828 [Ochromonadaceae sp. CCMP2298]|nr:hypothetical protein B484DRAFT_402828 [Ochromonadaceae sp. CCMP2298]
MSVKFSPPNALFLVQYLSGLNAKDLPPAFPYGKKVDRFVLLAGKILGNVECPFPLAKNSTVVSWLKASFKGVDAVGVSSKKLTAELKKTGQQLNMEEYSSDVIIRADGTSTCTTLDLLAEEMDVQKSLGLVYAAPASKSVQVITECSAQNKEDTMQVLVQLIMVHESVAAWTAAEARKARMAGFKSAQSDKAGKDLVDPDADEDDRQDQDEDDDDAEAAGDENKEPSTRGNKAPPKQSKKRKSEGPPLGEGRTMAESGGGLLGLLDRIVQMEAPSSSSSAAPAAAITPTATAVLTGDPKELAAWAAIQDVESYQVYERLDEVRELFATLGVKEPSHLRELGRNRLADIAQALKVVPAKLVRKVISLCTPENSQNQG